MTHGSLFSGIGGFDLAAEWMEWENVFHCEKDEFCQKVLKYHFPNAITYTDIKETDFTLHAGAIDILTGGFPCQPFSKAGKRKGTADDRHLWPEMLRAIREISPRWVVGENVRSIVSWSKGLVFEQVQADLENEGYEVLPFILPAAGVGAPHRRDRVWFIAHAKDDRYECGETGNKRHEEQLYTRESEQFKKDGCESIRHSGITPHANAFNGRKRAEREDGEEIDNGSIIVANSNGNIRRERRVHTEESEETERYISPCGAWANGKDWKNFPTQSPLCGGDDGIPCKLDGITLSKWRRESLRAYGNAVVPKLPYQIFQAIEQYERYHLY